MSIRVMNYLLRIFLVVLYLHIISAENGVKSRIVGGQPANISSLRYLVQVRRTDALCGGSLIRPRWVLTAAHCAYGYRPNDFTIVGGTSTLQGTSGISRRVINIFIAPQFTRTRLNMDAALLKLEVAMTGPNIQPIPLANNILRNVPIRVAGWGTTESGNVSNHVLSTRLPISNTAACSQAYRGQIPITNYMFCAYAAGRDTCSGDSGGPAVQNGRLAGIVSFGIGCARPGIPGVYTNVPAIKPWALNIIRNNSQ